MNEKDAYIRKLAEAAGFWGVDVWWKDSIPKFRKLLVDFTLTLDDVCLHKNTEMTDYGLWCRDCLEFVSRKDVK